MSSYDDSAYAFVSINGPRDTKPTDAKTRTLIRKHAMQKVAKKKRRIRKNAQFEVLFDHFAIPTLPLDPGAGRKNPFGVYPAPMTMRMHETMEILYRKPPSTYCFFTSFWFSSGMRDAAVFFQMLRSASLALISSERNSLRYRHDAVAYQAASFRSIKEKIADFRLETALDTLRSIISLAGHAILTADAKSWKIHMTAAVKVSRLIGENGDFELPGDLQVVMFFVDVTGSEFLDMVPHFEIPSPRIHDAESIIAKGHVKQHQKYPSPFSSLLDPSEHLYIVLEDIQLLGQYLDSRSWEYEATKLHDVIFMLKHVSPFMDRLLRVRVAERSRSFKDNFNIKDLIRLGSIISLPRSRELSVIQTVIVNIYVERVLSQLSSTSTPVPVEIELWLQMMCCMQLHSTQRRRKIQSRLDEIRKSLNISEWETMRDILKSMIWIDCIHEQPGKAIWEELEWTEKLRA